MYAYRQALSNFPIHKHLSGKQNVSTNICIKITRDIHALFHNVSHDLLCYCPFKNRNISSNGQRLSANFSKNFALNYITAVN